MAEPEYSVQKCPCAEQYVLLTKKIFLFMESIFVTYLQLFSVYKSPKTIKQSFVLFTLELTREIAEN